MSKGVLMVNEIAFPVADITLEGGEVVVHAWKEGPFPPVSAPWSVLYGNDGTEVCRVDVAIDVPGASNPGTVAYITQPIVLVQDES